MLKLDVKAYCATNGSREHAINCMKKIGIDDLFEGKVMDIVDFNFKPKPNAESLKLLCDKFQIPTNEETVYVEDICKIHLEAYKKIKKEKKSYEFNCGVGNGHSVLKILKTFEKVVDNNDKRKYNLIPSSQTIKEFEEWAKVFKGF